MAAAPPSEDGIQNETNFRAAQRMGKVELTIHSTWHTKLLSIQEIGRSSTEILWKPQVTTVANDKNNNGNNGNNNNNTQHRSEKHFWGGKTQKRRFLTFKQTLDQCGTWPTPPSSVAHCGCGSRVLGGYKKIIDARNTLSTADVWCGRDRQLDRQISLWQIGVAWYGRIFGNRVDSWETGTRVIHKQIWSRQTHIIIPWKPKSLHVCSMCVQCMYMYMYVCMYT